jgi:hypothetical protein
MAAKLLSSMPTTTISPLAGWESSFCRANRIVISTGVATPSTPITNAIMVPHNNVERFASSRILSNDFKRYSINIHSKMVTL